MARARAADALRLRLYGLAAGWKYGYPLLQHFYKQRGPHTYHYVIADFGRCIYDLDAANPWTGRNDTRLRCSLLCLCDDVLNYPFRVHEDVEGLKEPYVSVMRPLLDESAFVRSCSGTRAKELYDDLVRVVAPGPMIVDAPVEAAAGATALRAASASQHAPQHASTH